MLVVRILANVAKVAWLVTHRTRLSTVGRSLVYRLNTVGTKAEPAADFVTYGNAVTISQEQFDREDKPEMQALRQFLE